MLVPIEEVEGDDTKAGQNLDIPQNDQGEIPEESEQLSDLDDYLLCEDKPKTPLVTQLDVHNLRIDEIERSSSEESGSFATSTESSGSVSRKSKRSRRSRKSKKSRKSRKGQKSGRKSARGVKREKTADKVKDVDPKLPQSIMRSKLTQKFANAIRAKLMLEMKKQDAQLSLNVIQRSGTLKKQSSDLRRDRKMSNEAINLNFKMTKKEQSTKFYLGRSSKILHKPVSKKSKSFIRTKSLKSIENLANLNTDMNETKSISSKHKSNVHKSLESPEMKRLNSQKDLFSTEKESQAKQNFMEIVSNSIAKKINKT